MAQPVESDLNKKAGTRLEELPTPAEVQPPGFEQHHRVWDPQKDNALVSNTNENGSYSTSSISSGSGADMEARDKFDPGMAKVLTLHANIDYHN